MIDPDLIDWIQRDQSDAAQRVREAIAPTVQELAALLRRIQPLTPQPIKWVVHMQPEVYSSMLPMRRRKLQPYIRAAWSRYYANVMGGCNDDDGHDHV